MSTDLEQLRDHARSMAALTQPVTRQATSIGPGGVLVRTTVVLAEVPTDADRLLWTQIADEIDAYLTRPDEDQPIDLGGTP